jgi:hypothetical protein
MLKKTILFTDYNGLERTEDYYFNLSKAELMEMEMGIVGGFVEMIDKIVKAKDTPELIKVFKDLILKAYGEKSADGKRFIKSPEIATAFSQTEAYTNLFMELATDDVAAAAFVNGIMPKVDETRAPAAQSAVPQIDGTKAPAVQPSAPHIAG